MHFRKRKLSYAMAQSSHSAWLLLLQTVLISLLSTTCRGMVPAVIVFGDSSVDTGNNNWIRTIARSNFPPYGQSLPFGVPTGRFCNGKLVPDLAADRFGIKEFVPAYLNPTYGISEFATGVDFASAGTGYDNATSDVLSVIPLWKQIEYYKEYQSRLREHLGTKTANTVLSEALYIISIGTNDFLENYYNSDKRKRQYTIDKYQDYLISLAEKFLRTIYSLGARKISLGGIMPMGCLPLERATNRANRGACREDYNAIARNFNSKLNQTVIKLNKELKLIKLVFSNPYPVFKEILEKPELHGFLVVDRGCCGTGNFEMGFMCSKLTTITCPDPDVFVFWDSFHPTEKTNKVILDYLVKNEWKVFLDKA